MAGRLISRSPNLAPDTTPPSVPTLIGSGWSARTTTTVTLAFNPSTDNRSVVGYYASVNGVENPTLFQTDNCVLTGLTPNTAYTFTVVAVDQAGNRSAASSTVSVSTLSAGGDPSIVLTPGSGSMQIQASGSPGSSLTIVEWEFQRFISGVWTNITATRVPVASEVPAKSTATPTKYVDPSGTLAGNAAYTTLQAAELASVAGDEIVCNGTFYENLAITHGGTASNKIRWRAYDYNNPPVIDGQVTVDPPGWFTNGTGDAHLVAVAAANVIFDGFVVQNSKQHGIGVGACYNNGSFFFDSEPWFTGIEVYRCVVKNCAGAGMTTWKAEGHKIGGCDFTGTQKGSYWEVAAGNPVGWGSAVVLAGRDAWFVENKVRQCMGEGIHVGYHGDAVEPGAICPPAKGFTIRRNQLYDCWSEPIYVTLGSSGVIEENLIFMSNDPRFWYGRSTGAGYPLYCVGIGSELGAFGNPTAVYDSGFAGVTDVVIRNNIINGANELFKFARYTDDGNYKNIDIDHNTIYCPKGAFSSIYSCIKNEATAAGNEMTNIRFRNNAVVCADASDISTQWEALGTGKVSQGNFFSYSPPSDLADASNIINATANALQNQTYSATSSGWPNEVTFDKSSAAPYLSGSTVSVLVNSKAPITGCERDYYGYTRPTHTSFRDIGAVSRSIANDSTWEETGLSWSTPYEYRARYRKSDGTLSSYSASVTATTLPPQYALNTKFGGLTWVQVADYGQDKDYRLSGTDSFTGQSFTESLPILFGTYWGLASFTLQLICGVGRSETPDQLFTRTFATVDGLPCVGITRNYDPYVGVDQASARLKTATAFASQSMVVYAGKVKVPAGLTQAEGKVFSLAESKYNYTDSKLQIDISYESSKWYFRLVAQGLTGGRRVWNNTVNGTADTNSSPAQDSFFANSDITIYFREIADPRGKWLSYVLGHRMAAPNGAIAGNGPRGWAYAALGVGSTTVPVDYASCTQELYVEGINMAFNASPGMTIAFPYLHYVSFNCAGLPFYWTDVRIAQGDWFPGAPSHPANAV